MKKYQKRQKMSNKASKSVFKKTVAKVKPINVNPNAMRGGIRM
jgi:hypothetical protein